MDALLHLVHCVFLGHGFKRAEEDGEPNTSAQHACPVRVRYTHQTHTSLVATYVPVQRHLAVYAASVDAEAAPTRVTVQLGMAVQSVQAKVDYLLLYPLVYRQCLPTMPSLPPEVCFAVLAALALPGLVAVGCASTALSSAVFEDDVLWWRVLLALPQSPRLSEEMERAMGGEQGQTALAAGVCRRLVREEVGRQRREAEERRRRREAERRMYDPARNPLMVQPPRQPRPFPGGPGGFMIGGPEDLMPGGGFMPPGPFGGRRPFGGGGGGGFGPF